MPREHAGPPRLKVCPGEEHHLLQVTPEGSAGSRGGGRGGGTFPLKQGSGHHCPQWLLELSG